MKYVLLFVFVLPTLSLAQSKVTGLGKYRIGITTPDSLNHTEFKEEDQSYVKGTIALPCTHIRTFTSATVTVAGVLVANIVLAFYDNTLFKISCEYSHALKEVFTDQHGQGVQKPMSRFQFCTKENDMPLLMWGEAWHNGDIRALIVHMKGYTANCRLEEGAKLTIFSQKSLVLSSECDLKHTDRFIEEFDKAQKEN